MSARGEEVRLSVKKSASEDLRRRTWSSEDRRDLSTGIKKTCAGKGGEETTAKSCEALVWVRLKPLEELGFASFDSH